MAEAPRTVLDLLAEAEERATPGPWVHKRNDGAKLWRWILAPDVAVAAVPVDTPGEEPNAALIALLRNHAAELIAVVEAGQQSEIHASEAHDCIYAKPFDQQAASAAIWRLHNILRTALAPLLADAPEGEA